MIGELLDFIVGILTGGKYMCVKKEDVEQAIVLETSDSDVNDLWNYTFDERMEKVMNNEWK